MTTGIDSLGRRFWRWRAVQQPRSRDDLPRITRPPGWLPDWRGPTVRRHRRELAAFEQAIAALPSTSTVADVVDLALLGSATARVRFELDVVRAWQRQPGFYVDQSIGVVYDALLPRPEWPSARRAAVLRGLRAVPGMLREGLANLDGHVVPEFAAAAGRELDQVEDQVTATIGELREHFPPGSRAELTDAGTRAAAALGDYRRSLSTLRPGDFPGPLGAEGFAFFRHRVALLPYDPDEMIETGRAAFARAVRNEEEAATAVAAGRPAPATTAEQIARHDHAERAVLAHYRDAGLLDLPGSLRGYRALPMPGYLMPLCWLAVTDDLGGCERPGDAVTYVPPVGHERGFFDLANVRDARLGVLHEGAHAQQLALSWTNPRPLRRRYYDSAPNEGIAFYNEELLLRSGLLDDNPDARRAVWTFMRLRALRVEVDVGLALGRMTIEDAAGALAAGVPLDDATARQEAAFFAATPGQGLSYQIGKTQIERLIAAARERGHSPAEVHTWLWRNGNVPIALLRWELLGSRDELDRIGTPVMAGGKANDSAAAEAENHD
ncbi:DUF885 family protein [Actinoplanes sp. NPDC048796]|uniref:DUF885 family protein n=1 Tax=unclassified Actinoplanes TaxID=2626549 RepID=UPI0033F27F89